MADSNLNPPEIATFWCRPRIVKDERGCTIVEDMSLIVVINVPAIVCCESRAASSLALEAEGQSHQVPPEGS
jgi:hypothetical protein